MQANNLLPLQSIIYTVHISEDRILHLHRDSSPLLTLQDIVPAVFHLLSPSPTLLQGRSSFYEMQCFVLYRVWALGREC